MSRPIAQSRAELTSKLASQPSGWPAELDRAFGAASDAFGRELGEGIALSLCLDCLNSKLLEALQSKLKAGTAPLPQSTAYRLVDLWGSIKGNTALLDEISDASPGHSAAERRSRLAGLVRLSRECFRSLVGELSEHGLLGSYTATSEWVAKQLDSPGIVELNQETKDLFGSLDA